MTYCHTICYDIFIDLLSIINTLLYEKTTHTRFSRI